MISPKLPILNNDINQKYQLLAKIGSGGMGDVFLGIQRGAVDFSRIVVIKRIHDREVPVEYAEENARMFINEASVIASLNHPHIVKIFDFCTTGTSVCIVMEYVEGETLRYIFSECDKQKKRIPVGMTCRLIYDACNTLHYAHNSTSPTGESRKVVHRDIGLHNLMLDSNGYLKVIDFGIAKSGIQGDMTTPGLIKGNPSYMAPDLFNKTDQDHRIDVYALGLCLYELLTQTRAFQFSRTATVGEVIQEITTRQLPPPSQLMPEIPGGIDEVIAKAVEKDRDKRYQSVEEFGRELKSVADKVFMSGRESKLWFNENFGDRLKERREFGKKILEIAKKSDTASEMTIPSRLTMGPYSLTPTATRKPPPPPPSGRRVIAANRYTTLAIIIVLFIVAGVNIYLLVLRDSAPPKEEVTIGDNLVVNCEPAGARLSINGRELGLIGSESLSFHVEPNMKHEIVLSKKGYRDFTLPFIGPASGMKKIAATLIKIDAEAEEGAATDAVDQPDREPPPSHVSTHDEATNESRNAKSGHKRQRHPTARRRPTPDDEKETTASEVPESDAPLRRPILLNENRRRIPLPDDDESANVPLLVD